MASDGDDSVLTDDQEESFLTGTESISEDLSFGLASGINAGRVGRAIAGSIVFAVALGVNTVIGALTEAYTGLVDGVSEFLAGGTEFVNNPNAVGGFEQEFDGLIEVIFGSGIAAIRGAWSFSLTQFGPLAYPVGIGVVVASFWVMGRGIDRIREVS
ncbi:hypothetical protein [Halorubrum cibi]|uniref:Uncharacterized protein n=1 Tax=Halorubrum cibi TaxID=413815 RepID=A0A521EBG8_9EURY|nr:hypothetical protein [Halorubrum cibi]SMO81257.1 hypothetical protein SAMN06264867_1107 [Halorubrum cibi]